MAQNEDKWRTVKIPAGMIAPVDDLVKNVRDEFGLPLFKSRAEVLVQALKEFFRTRKEFFTGDLR